MNARSVSNRARRLSGQMLIVAAVMFVPAFARGNDVVITVRGTLAGGPDGLRIFGLGRYLPKGTPFTLVAIFDDSKGSPSQRAAAAAFWRGGTNSHRIAPVMAVLTINGKSHKFRSTTIGNSDAFYWFKTSCSKSEIAFAVVEATSCAGIKITPPESPAQTVGCQTPVSIADEFRTNSLTGFIIGKLFDTGHETRSMFNAQSVVVSQRK